MTHSHTGASSLYCVYKTSFAITAISVVSSLCGFSVALRFILRLRHHSSFCGVDEKKTAFCCSLHRDTIIINVSR